TPTAAGTGSGVQITTPQHTTTGGPLSATPTAAGTGTGPQTAQAGPPVAPPAQAPAMGQGAPAADPSRWPAPPPGVPSWGPTGPPPDEGQAASPQQVQEWIETARQVLVDQGVDPSLMNADQMAGLIQHESSNNPHAINLWDSNATAGHPSKGLMQTIDSTFAEHHLPGYGNIWAPVDNILAGTRYAIDRYGSISNVPGVRAVQDGGDYVGY
ncbi:transglycosylase SLT domain-containing protein, partial [Actinophytocola sp.]|uniref:transglycosylase SLT domain-containing protein n=1 Tax=Actinophytocola sp. TaxID=1872138 RepID=UPI003D6A722A